MTALTVYVEFDGCVHDDGDEDLSQSLTATGGINVEGLDIPGGVVPNALVWMHRTAPMVSVVLFGERLGHPGGPSAVASWLSAKIAESRTRLKFGVEFAPAGRLPADGLSGAVIISKDVLSMMGGWAQITRKVLESMAGRELPKSAPAPEPV